MKGILLTEDGELLVEDGGLKIGNNKLQVAQHIVIATQGEYKHAPHLGGNTRRLICGVKDPFWQAKAEAQLKSEDIEVEELEFKDNNIVISVK